MPDDQVQKAAIADEAPRSGADVQARRGEQWTRWSNLWQVPTILASLALIVAGVHVAMRKAPRNDFTGALDEVEALVAQGEVEMARHQLEEVIEPNLHQASDEERGRFHAVVGDWLFARQEIELAAAEAASASQNYLLVGEEYAQAIEHGFLLAPPRLERWAAAAIAAGDLESARQRLAELETLSLAEGADPSLRQRRNRVLRLLVEHSLRRSDVPLVELMKRLDDYRQDPLLAPGDSVWAVARQAELRLAAGRPTEAVQSLLVDLRRLEDMIRPAGGPPEPGEGSVFGELYALLGRAYERLGDFTEAPFHLDAALAALDTSDPARGEALLVRGRIALAEGDLDLAFESFDEVVREFVGTGSHLPALLGRAEVHALRGDHQRSLEDYRFLAAEVEDAPPRSDLSAEIVTAALIDRHDAALASGRLPLALAFGQIAEALFDAPDVPAEILVRLALVSRQSADNLLGRARRRLDEPLGDWRVPPDVDPETRREALRHYENAGDYASRHARALRAATAQPAADGAWADSLWLAAESFDLAGRTSRAIELYGEYVATRPGTDARRPQALLAVAGAHQADLRHEAALAAYEQLRSEYPGTIEAARSHVPMARALVALERKPEAEQLLQQVLAGGGDLEPDAREYRDALIELGRLLHEQGKHARAIERLREALERYGDDVRIDEVRFRLADSLRAHALALSESLDTEPTLVPLKVQEQRRLVRASLEEAEGLFGHLVASLGDVEAARRGSLEDDMLRYSSLYQADCAFYLGDSERAVGLYEQAARRYRNDGASMNALVQIVNCYSESGKVEEAAAAHARALERLRQLPDSAFAAQSLMDRSAWERWLRSRPPGGVRAAAVME